MDSLEGLDIPDDAVLARTVRVTSEGIWNERLGRDVSWRYDRILWDGGSLPEHSQGEDYELYGWDRFRESYHPVQAIKGFLFILMTRDSHLVYTLFLTIQIQVLNMS